MSLWVLLQAVALILSIAAFCVVCGYLVAWTIQGLRQQPPQTDAPTVPSQRFGASVASLSTERVVELATATEKRFIEEKAQDALEKADMEAHRSVELGRWV